MRIRIVVFSLFGLLLSSCTGSRHVQIVEQLKEENLPNIKSRNGITLLPHQVRPIYFLRKHPKQKGLLINHYLGTGKTYLSLGFAEQFQNKKVVVLLPRFLKSNWHGTKGELRDCWGYLLTAILVVLVLAIAIGGIISLNQFFEYRQCNALENFETSRDYRWSYWTGCLVQTTEGFWIDANSPRLKEVTGELDIELKEAF